MVGELPIIQISDLSFDGSKKIGEGQFGTVYKAKWRGQTVAVKKLNSETTDLSSFYQEAQIMARVGNHANIVRLMGVCLDPDHTSIVTQFYSLGSCYRLYVKDKRQIPWLDTLRVVKGAAAGILHLHAENYIHRDIASRNILVSDSFDGVVTDFGMSKLQLKDAPNSSSSIGPVKWMSPESISKYVVSKSTDVYMFGGFMYELVAREIPYGSEDPIIVALRVIEKGCTLQIPENCDREYAQLMKRCLAYNADERPTFVEILAVLEKLYDQEELNQKNNTKTVIPSLRHNLSRVFPRMSVPVPNPDFDEDEPVFNATGVQLDKTPSPLVSQTVPKSAFPPSPSFSDDDNKSNRSSKQAYLSASNASNYGNDYIDINSAASDSSETKYSSISQNSLHISSRLQPSPRHVRLTSSENSYYVDINRDLEPSKSKPQPPPDVYTTVPISSKQPVPNSPALNDAQDTTSRSAPTSSYLSSLVPNGNTTSVNNNKNNNMHYEMTQYSEKLDAFPQHRRTSLPAHMSINNPTASTISLSSNAVVPTAEILGTKLQYSKEYTFARPQWHQYPSAPSPAQPKLRSVSTSQVPREGSPSYLYHPIQSSTQPVYFIPLPPTQKPLPPPPAYQVSANSSHYPQPSYQHIPQVNIQVTQPNSGYYQHVYQQPTSPRQQSSYQLQPKVVQAPALPPRQHTLHPYVQQPVNHSISPPKNSSLANSSPQVYYSPPPPHPSGAGLSFSQPASSSSKPLGSSSSHITSHNYSQAPQPVSNYKQSSPVYQNNINTQNNLKNNNNPVSVSHNPQLSHSAPYLIYNPPNQTSSHAPLSPTSNPYQPQYPPVNKSPNTNLPTTISSHGNTSLPLATSAPLLYPPGGNHSHLANPQPPGHINNMKPQTQSKYSPYGAPPY